MAEDYGLARFKWDRSAPWAVRSAIADGMERGAEYLKKAMKRLLNVPYPPASKPGQSPRRRTGNLYRSINVWINRKTLEVQVGPNEDAEYGIYLEYGAPKANLKPRPFMFKALKLEQKRIANTVNRATAIAFNKLARQRK